MKPEDVTWMLEWAKVLQKVKQGANQDGPIQLSRRECQTMILGLQRVSGAAKERD